MHLFWFSHIQQKKQAQFVQISSAAVNSRFRRLRQYDVTVGLHVVTKLAKCDAKQVEVQRIETLKATWIAR